MRPPFLPPLPILLACAIWFLHGFGPLAFRSYSVLFRNDSVDIFWDSCYFLFFLPFMLGTLLIVTGTSDWRVILCVFSFFMIVVEFVAVAATIGSSKFGFAATVMTIDLFALTASIVLTLKSESSYLRWLQQWKDAPPED